ncbi:hypothetical protein J6590_002871 [Homalodisca vitripennis]|nr:hypothetical protein J6590_002871 [Homalodisca vitripennis]
MVRRVDSIEFEFSSSSPSFLLQRLVSDAVSDLTPGIWSHVLLKRSNESRRPISPHRDKEFEAMIRRDLANIVPGLGDNGTAVKLSGEEAKLAQQVMRKEAINLVASNKVSYNRTVVDNRHPLCKSVQYDDDLPPASVVIIFNNEGWSSLIRTVHSVLNRSPAHLLKEIILVDDNSDRGLFRVFIFFCVNYQNVS